jgi:hypothetical protein
MKRIFTYALSTLLLFAAGCQKADDGPTIPASTDIFGRWRLDKMVGGLTGQRVSYPTPPITDVFNQDSSFQRCTGGSCVALTTYFIRTQRSFITGKQERILTIQKRVYLAAPDTGSVLLNDRYRILEIGNNLILDQDRPDGYTNYYQRM